MGQEASKPKPGTKLQVIGAGLPRTGTASFSKALEILLNGPVHHGGTQVTRGPESEIRSWIAALEHTPIKSAEDDKVVRETLRNHLDDGFAAVLDVPGMLFLEELLEMHPGVKVICTVRDPDAWVRSIQRRATRLCRPFCLLHCFSSRPCAGSRGTLMRSPRVAGVSCFPTKLLCRTAPCGTPTRRG
ncbi:hypothetical protein CGCSCA5_v004015 [Colletotrichum siamense]|nr:hypothetical protein CGCSCA5_v004015 [Colletotrichum siamense]KAF4879378.1 hypothetical protein CGCSCA1_v001471 [Colletotrichum siamense]